MIPQTYEELLACASNGLNQTQLKKFSTIAALTHSCWGGRKFQAEIEVNGKKEKIIASAKDVYKQIEKIRQSSEDRKIFNQFHAREIKTRDKAVFSKRLNLPQKIYYFIVKALFGLNFKDTWTNKFLWNPEQIEAVYRNFDDVGSIAREGLIAKKIQNAFKTFNGMSCDLVLVNVFAGRGLGFVGPGLISTESLWGLNWYDNPEFVNTSNYDILKNRYKFFREEIFNNPKALVVPVCFDPDYNHQDTSIPEDVKCGVYHMTRKEFNALPRISSRLKKFMNEFNATVKQAKLISSSTK